MSENSLLCFSRFHVNHTVWLPILIGSTLALSKIKNCVVNRTTPHSPARSLKRHSLRHKFIPRGKIFSVLWTTVIRCVLPGRFSMDGFFPTTLTWEPLKLGLISGYHHTEKYWDRSKWSLTTFDLTRFVVLAENFDRKRDGRDTDTTDTVDTSVYVLCHLIHVLWCKRLGKVSQFHRK